MIKYFCKPKTGLIPNAMIEAIKFENHWHVEIWDVFSEYNSLQLFEDERKNQVDFLNLEIKLYKEKLTNNKTKDTEVKSYIENLKKQVRELERYKNKRFKLTDEEFNNKYEILSKFEL